MATRQNLDEISGRTGTTLSAIVAGTGIAFTAAVLVYSVHTLDGEGHGLTGHVLAEVDRTGVEHPVTAVLLNLRAYDTWMELVVLLAGLLGVLAMRGTQWRTAGALRQHGDIVLPALVRLIVPLMVLVAGYFLWLGKTAAGGAFQAGVVLGVGLVLLWYAGFPSIQRMPRLITVVSVLVGVCAFLLAAVLPLLQNRAILEFPVAHASTIILLIETAASVSIGVIVAFLIIAVQPIRDR
jgi:multisubunit Na+/H+ antiporter MnhB subunit